MTKGRFGIHGGQYIPETLMNAVLELEEAYGRLEDLNREMRAQRHDFMNHLQVVYSLIEMNEPGEAGYSQ